jgi:hypothetical protein
MCKSVTLNPDIESVIKLLKRVFSNPIIASIIGGVATGIIITVWNSITKNINLVRSFINIATNIYHIKIPEFYLIVLIALLLGWVFTLNKKINKTSKYKNAEKLEAKPETLKHEKFMPNEEHLLILEQLANDEAEALSQDDLFRDYVNQFPRNERKHFKFILNDLEKNQMIRISSMIEGSIFYSVTSEGLSTLSGRASKH